MEEHQAKSRLSLPEGLNLYFDHLPLKNETRYKECRSQKEAARAEDGAHYEIRDCFPFMNREQADESTPEQERYYQ
ncbi:hypothetical protein ACPJHQ_15670 [Rossellomorea sp. H39__3]